MVFSRTVGVGFSIVEAVWVEAFKAFRRFLSFVVRLVGRAAVFFRLTRGTLASHEVRLVQKLESCSTRRGLIRRGFRRVRSFLLRVVVRRV